MLLFGENVSVRLLNSRITFAVFERPFRVFNNFQLLFSWQVVKAPHWKWNALCVHHLGQIELHSRGHIEPHRMERFLRRVFSLLINANLQCRGHTTSIYLFISMSIQCHYITKPPPRGSAHADSISKSLGSEFEA
jgi:hypothetical protein